MILPALVALPVALGPLMLGGSPLWARSLIHIATAAGLALWLCWRIAVGYVPMPSRRNLFWTGSLLLLGSVSLWVSPVRADTTPDWYTFLNALWMFPFIAAVSKDERRLIDQALRVSGWILMLLAFHQRLSAGGAPSSTFQHPGFYAGAALLLLPLALERRDWLLGTGLLVTLWWTRSLGAWTGLFAAMVLFFRWKRSAGIWVGAAGLLVCLVVIYSRFQSPDVLCRLAWWKAAAAMALDRPLLGQGPGAFVHVLSGYLAPSVPSAPSADQIILQTAAEYGLVFAGLWFAGLWRCLMCEGNEYKRFGVLAVLVQSLWEWPFGAPSNLWLLAYFAASSISETSRGLNVRSRWRIPCALAVAVAGCLVCFHVWGLCGAGGWAGTASSIGAGR